MSSTLIGAPEAEQLLPPVCIKELEADCTRSFARGFRVGVSMMLTALALILLMAGSRDQGAAKLLYVAASIAVLIGISITDYKFFLSRIDTLCQRAQFFVSLQTSRTARQGFWWCAAMMIAAGTGQFIAVSMMGGRDEVLTAVGTMYTSVKAGEWWRLITGPYLHAHTVHHLANFATGLLIAPVAWACLGWRPTVIVFLVANLVAATAQVLGSSAGDVFVGVSGGVFGVYGMVIGAAVVRRGVLPPGGWLPLLGVFAMSMLLAPALAPDAAHYAHAAGFVVGLAFGLAWAKLFRPQSAQGKA
jgi:membrane associated rhomboid family serine protease